MDSTIEDDGLLPTSSSAHHSKQASQPVQVIASEAVTHSDSHEKDSSESKGMLPNVIHDTHNSRAVCGVVLQPIDIDDIIDRVMKADDEAAIDQHSESSSSIDVFKESIDVINLLNHTAGSNVDILTTNSTDFIQSMPASSPPDDNDDSLDLYDAANNLSPPYCDKSLFETDSIETEEEEVPESDGSQRKILDLILTLQQRLQIQGDAADEWENDEDTGYMIVALAEEDFFELEEETSIRMMEKEARGEEVVAASGAAVSMGPSQPAQSPFHSALEELDSESTAKDAKAPNQVPSVQSTTSMVWDTIAGSISNVIAAVTSSPNLPPPSGPLPPPPPLTNEEVRPDETIGNADPTRGRVAALKKMSLGEQRRTEIMGQRKFLGADGLHSYFNLKVIFEPFKTGFEESKDLQHPKGTIIAGRYEVFDMLGQAAFSTALQCMDLAAEEDEAQWVCLKVIKNNKDFFDQSLDEIKLLQYINSCGDPDRHHVLRLIDFFYCKEHLFIVSELLKENLYEFGRFLRDSHGEPYYTIPRLKRIMKQVLEALVFIHSLKLIHCDIKPENIVIKSFSRCEVKLIDFGSSCFTSDHLTTYIQSRSYRAPEVIIGYDYDARIDIWSVGAVLAELHTGYVLFQNDSVPTMLSRITGILGPFPNHVLEASRETGKYFSLSNIVFERDEEGSFNLIFPKKTNLRSRLHLAASNNLDMSTDDALFLDFVRQMLHLDPAKRMTAAEALAHPWLADADSIYVKEYIIGETNNNAPKQQAPSTANGSADMSDEFDDAEYEEDAVAEAQEEAALEYAYFMSNHPQDASTVDAYLRYLQEKRQNFFEDEDEDDEYSDAPDDHYVDDDEGNEDDEDEGNGDEDEGDGDDEDEGDDDDDEDEVDDDGEDVPQEEGVSLSAIEGPSGARDLADDPREA